MIGIFGAGVVGARVAESLSIESQTSIVVYDSSQIVAQRLARRLSETNSLIKATNRSELHRAKVVVLAGPSPHTPVAKEFLGKGVSIVSTSDDIADCLNLLSLSDLATENKATLIIGSASSPGMSGLLVRNLSKAFDSIDEVHIALLAAGPSFKQSFESDLPTSNVDLVPTILHLHQLPIPATVNGRVMHELLINSKTTAKPIVKNDVIETSVNYKGGIYKLLLNRTTLDDYQYINFAKVIREKQSATGQ